MSTPEQRLKMAQFIVDLEARRDGRGRIKVYPIPSGDGGGTYEIAGINDRYHPQKAAELREMIKKGEHAAAEAAAVVYLARYTEVVAGWTPHVAVEAFLRDCCFNRGAGGAGKMYQMALGVPSDGMVGPLTLEVAGRVKAAAVPELLKELRRTREQYERVVAKRDERSKFWKGLVNRWEAALRFAQLMHEES